MCLGTGLFFAFRAATPDARATATVQAVAVSETVDAATPDAELTTCNIEDIQAGDLVLARDEHGQEIGLKPVKEVYKRTSFHLRHLTFESTDGDQQTLSTTDEHPFWSVTADEFLEAGSLPVGHKVTDPHGKTQTLVSSTREEFPNGIPVFNFQVEDFHTYYVAANAGDDVLLVHNANCYDDARDFMSSNPNASMFEINVQPRSPLGFRNIGNVPGFDGSQSAHAFATMVDEAGDLRVYDRFANGMLLDEYLDLYRRSNGFSVTEFIENIRVGFPVLNGNGGLSPITGR